MEHWLRSNSRVCLHVCDAILEVAFVSCRRIEDMSSSTDSMPTLDRWRAVDQQHDIGCLSVGLTNDDAISLEDLFRIWWWWFSYDGLVFDFVIGRIKVDDLIVASVYVHVD